MLHFRNEQQSLQFIPYGNDMKVVSSWFATMTTLERDWNSATKSHIFQNAITAWYFTVWFNLFDCMNAP